MSWARRPRLLSDQACCLIKPARACWRQAHVILSRSLTLTPLLRQLAYHGRQEPAVWIASDISASQISLSMKSAWRCMASAERAGVAAPSRRTLSGFTDSENAGTGLVSVLPAFSAIAPDVKMSTERRVTSGRSQGSAGCR